ncbi:MAG TPA: efflux RND transporter permease subunit, partial [Xanthomonadales bacterium]|nr:efflux RND transporter permease subunit [Xanthomonadales bacterium]
PHDAAPDVPTRIINRLFGWLFRPFNRMFHKVSSSYSFSVGRNLRRSAAILVLYVGLLGLTGYALFSIPGGFIPTQDKLYLVGGVKMPEGSSLDRTEAVVRQFTDMALSTEGIDHAVAFPGLNVLQFNNTPNTATVFLPLKSFSERQRPAAEIAAELQGKLGTIQEAFAFAFMPPAILGLGTGSGFSLYIQDRANLGYGELQNAVQAMSGALSQQPGFQFPITSYQANVPQLETTVDRVKAKRLGVPLTEVFESLQIYLGSIYVNDFNRFGRTYQVIAQADAPFRNEPEDITDVKVRSQSGEMVPVGTVVTVSETYGPDPVIRYNGYPAADLVGEADPRVVSSSQAIQTITNLAPQVLGNGFDFEWTDLSYQQTTQGNAAIIVFPLAVLLVFLVLAALYESWVLPLAVILIVPLSVLAALAGVWFTGGDINIFVQVGLVVLMGLACKNAILIVEFARELERDGMSLARAAITASKLRLRPIVMTSVAFIAGVVPLILSSGAGAEVREVMGITVFSGMIGVTLFGLVMTPVFYVVLRKGRRLRQDAEKGLA